MNPRRPMPSGPKPDSFDQTRTPPLAPRQTPLIAKGKILTVLVELKSLGLAESTLRSYWHRLETIAKMGIRIIQNKFQGLSALWASFYNQPRSLRKRWITDSLTNSALVARSLTSNTLSKSSFASFPTTLDSHISLTPNEIIIRED